MPALLDVLGRYRLLPTNSLAALAPFSTSIAHRAAKFARDNKFVHERSYSSRTDVALRRAIGLHLSMRAFRQFPALRVYSEHLTKPPSDTIALWTYRRGMLHAALKKDGYSVGRSARGLVALRRWLVDEQRARVGSSSASGRTAAERLLSRIREDRALIPLSKLTCATCGVVSTTSKIPKLSCDHDPAKAKRSLIEATFACRKCGTVSTKADAACCDDASPRLQEPIPYDIAFTKKPKKGLPPVMIVLVDEPFRSVTSLLEDLPLRNAGQPAVPILLRPHDPVSTWDIVNNRHTKRTQRYRQLSGAFDPNTKTDRGFNYSTTATPFLYRPDLGQRTTP